MKRWEAKDLPRDQVPLKRLQMAQVEYYSVALGNGAVVKGFRADDLEKQVGLSARGLRLRH
jgi:hypothetical protein